VAARVVARGGLTLIPKKQIDRLRVEPGKTLKLSRHRTTLEGTDAMRELGKDRLKARAEQILTRNLERLAQAQELLWASDTWSVLVVFQALDAAGKDGTIKHVMSGVNPQGCQVTSFKHPSAEELDHNFLWRYARALPERGRIGIFNRSHYEEVLVVRVHPEILARQKLPPGKRGRAFWEARYDDIVAFERHLAQNGTLILKFFLHISREEQKKRFLERIENPRKQWKFALADLEERGYWDDYMEAYQDALAATSRKWAPWYVIPADQKWVARAAVADILTEAILDLDLEWPKVGKEQRAVLAQAKQQLLAEQE
jgi:PPK2 family polyphosphate:nucleotide phosphotransferase